MESMNYLWRETAFFLAMTILKLTFPLLKPFLSNKDEHAWIFNQII